MAELLAPLVDPFRFPFMQRALLEVLVLALLAGVVGVHVVLRRLAFASDTLTHTVFPGVAVAFLLGQSIALGALVAGALSAVLLALLTTVRRVSQDAALAVLLTSFFAVGVVLVSRTSGYTANLSSFLVGDLLAVTTRQLAETAAVAAVALGGLAALHKELVLAAFDPAGARAMGYRTLLLDLALNLVIALVVVAAVRAVGVVLVIALLVVPAVTAQLVTERFAAMAVVSVSVAGLGGYFGLLVSFHGSVEYGLRLASGATVVVALVVLFGLVATVSAAVRALRRRAAGDGPGRVPAGTVPGAVS